MKASILFLFSILAGFSFTQNDSVFVSREKKLSEYLDVLRKAPDDATRESANTQFKSYLFETIQIAGAVDYPFAALKSVGTIKSPDNMFRLFNWNIEQNDESNKYFCYVLRFDERKKDWKVIELIDNSMMLPPQPEDVLDENMWYGALYYKIIPVEKSGKTIYTLLGYDANNSMSHTKLIDVISFSGNHAKLGSPIFKTKDQTYKRMFFEHSKKCVMSLSYDDARQKIIFDHLSPESPSMDGFREFYVPDMSYDAFKLSGNKWVLEEDVVGINKKNGQNMPVVRIDLNKDGSMVRHKEKGKWIDPSNPNAPAGQNIHTPAMPDEEVVPEPKKKKTKSEEFPKSKKNKKQKSAIGNTIPNKK